MWISFNSSPFTDKSLTITPVIHARRSHNLYEHVRTPKTLLVDHILTRLSRSISSIMVTQLMLNLRDPKLAPGLQNTTTMNTTINFGPRRAASTFFDSQTQAADFMESERSPRYHVGRREHHVSSGNSGAYTAELGCLLMFTIVGDLWI